MLFQVMHYTAEGPSSARSLCGLEDVHTYEPPSGKRHWQTHKVLAHPKGLPPLSDALVQSPEITCTACAKALGQKMLKAYDKKITFEPCGAAIGHLRGTVVKMDGVAICTLDFEAGDSSGWAVHQLGYFRRNADEEMRPHAWCGKPFQSYGWRVKGCEVDIGDKDWTLHSQKSSYGYRCAVRHRSKILAALWAAENLDLLMSERETRSTYQAYFNKVDAKRATDQREKDAEAQADADMRSAMVELYEREDLTNFQRSGLLKALEALCIKVPRPLI